MNHALTNIPGVFAVGSVCRMIAIFIHTFTDTTGLICHEIMSLVTDCSFCLRERERITFLRERIPLVYLVETSTLSTDTQTRSADGADRKGRAGQTRNRRRDFNQWDGQTGWLITGSLQRLKQQGYDRLQHLHKAGPVPADCSAEAALTVVDFLQLDGN